MSLIYDRNSVQELARTEFSGKNSERSVGRRASRRVSRAATHGLIKRKTRKTISDPRALSERGFSRACARMAQARRKSYRTIIVLYNHSDDVYRSTSQHFHSLLPSFCSPSRLLFLHVRASEPLRKPPRCD